MGLSIRYDRGSFISLSKSIILGQKGHVLSLKLLKKSIIGNKRGSRLFTIARIQGEEGYSTVAVRLYCRGLLASAFTRPLCIAPKPA